MTTGRINQVARPSRRLAGGGRLQGLEKGAKPIPIFSKSAATRAGPCSVSTPLPKETMRKRLPHNVYSAASDRRPDCLAEAFELREQMHLLCTSREFSRNCVLGTPFNISRRESVSARLRPNSLHHPKFDAN